MNDQADKERQEQERALLLANEADLLRGLLEAAADLEEKTELVTIARKGKVYFGFRVHGLTEEQYQECRRKATKFQKKNALGVKLPEETDHTRYRSLVIHEATVEEDRAKLWDNKEAWRQKNVLNGPTLIDKVLLAGEKEAVLIKIDELSGYVDDEEEGEAKGPEQRQEDLAKNS